MTLAATTGGEAAFLDFELPASAVAQRPLARREAARLMRVRRGAVAFPEGTCADLATWLRPGDLLVRNTTRVLPARLWLEKAAGGARIEMLLLEPAPSGWWVFLRPARRLGRGMTAMLADGTPVTVVEVAAEGRRRVEFPAGYDVVAAAEAFGSMPLPPYVQRPADDSDREAYQTVYARESGSVAAPTAGLHFSTALLDGLAARGIAIADLVLHVGPGTFQPLRHPDPGEHVMHAERFEIPAVTRAAVAAARASGRRVVAVGTTVVRALESAAVWEADPASSEVVASERAGDLIGRTRLFVRPPFDFQIVGAMLTNFHLPQSTLLLLVQSFTGAPTLRAAYAAAIERGYRFFSYGDAMLVESETV